MAPAPSPENAATGLSIKPFKIWIDMENTPHIPFFRPIIRKLREEGHDVKLTARDAYQTCEMAAFHSMPCIRIGRHYGKHTVSKIWGLMARGIQLLLYAKRERPDLAMNLGSRSQNLAAKILGIPVVEIMDYEHTAESSLLESRWYIVPDVVSLAMRRECDSDRIRTYHGLKEDVYVHDFQPDESLSEDLGLREIGTVVTIRPPATEAHYHNPEAELLLERVMDRVLGTADIKAVLLPRNQRQERELRLRYPDWFASRKVVIPEGVVDGLNLIWHSDLVISGGGTMNREAAALGVPVYSIYRGKIGAVDRNLRNLGRLVLIEKPDDVDQKIHLVPRLRHPVPDHRSADALGDIFFHLNAIVDSLRHDAPQNRNRNKKNS